MQYTKTTNFAVKDTLLSGNPAKVVKGAEIDVEFNNIATSTASSVDGPASATDGQVALFNGITGKLLKTGPVIQTSATDTTAGALMAVGAFGLPAVPNYLAAAIPTITDGVTDFDTITTQGWYSKLLGAAAGSRNPNFPTGQSGPINFVWLNVLKYTTNCAQVAYSYASSGGISPTIWMRILGGGVWSAWDKLVTDATSYGYNQTAVDVTGSRVISTTYTNTTGKPITCSIICSPASTNGTVQVVTINGATTYYGAYSPAPNGVITIIFMVPVGATYSCAINNGTAPLVTWKELR